jgi:hypothetical protein
MSIVNIPWLYKEVDLYSTFTHTNWFEDTVANIFIKQLGNSSTIQKETIKGYNHEFDFKLNGVGFEVKAQSCQAIRIDKEKENGRQGGLKDSKSKYYINFNVGKQNLEGGSFRLVVKCRIFETDFIRDYIIKNEKNLSPEEKERRKYFTYINPKELGESCVYLGFCPIVSPEGGDVCFDISKFIPVRGSFDFLKKEIKVDS